MKTVRIATIGALMVGFAALIGYRLIDTRPAPSGFCKAQGRILSDKEYIDIAVRERDARASSIPDHARKRHFDIDKPNCCRVYKDESSPRFKEEKHFYGYDDMVVVDLNNETDRTDRKFFNRGATDTIVMTACGEVTDRKISSPDAFAIFDTFYRKRAS
jgi:hypothetical protein